MSSIDAVPSMGIYEPILPRPFEVSDTQRGAYAYLTAIIGIVLAGLTVGVKLHMAASTFRKLRSDDWALIAATVLAIGYSVAICQAVKSGLGDTDDRMSGTQYRSYSQGYYASNLLLFASLACSKCSFALLLIAIQPTRWVCLSLYGTLSLSVVWGIASVFVVAFQCGPTRWALGPVDDTSCIRQYAALVGLKLTDILLDVLLAVLPTLMILKVQVSLAKRLIVALIFGLRLATPLFTAISLASLYTFYHSPASDRSFEAIIPSMWTTVSINVSLITACLPSIKRFLGDLGVGVGIAQMVEPFELQYSSASKSRKVVSSGVRFRALDRLCPYSKSAPNGELDITHTSPIFTRRPNQDRGEDDGDSKRGLTDGITQTVEFDVEYEQDIQNRNGSARVPNRGRQ